MVLDVLEPWIVLGSDVMEPIIVSRLTFFITPDEALVETRQKLVKEKIFGSIIEKMQTFGHILDASLSFCLELMDIHCEGLLFSLLDLHEVWGISVDIGIAKLQS